MVKWFKKKKRKKKEVGFYKLILLRVKGLERKLCVEWLRSLGLLSLEKARLSRDLIVVCNILRRGSGGPSTTLVKWQDSRKWPEAELGEI